MKDEEYAKLFEVERSHWFYCGKREIARLLISRLFPGREVRHLDAGCGSGLLVKELSREHRSFGVDASSASLIYATQIRCAFGSMGSLPFRSDAFDCTTSFDVLEHLDDDRGALRELVRVTRPGGFVLVNVPAFSVLWSDWDEALHHKRRYTKRAFSGIVPLEEAALERCFYLNPLLFLPVLAYRGAKRLVPGIFPRRLEDGVPPPRLNALLRKLLVSPVERDRQCLPFGTSLFGVLRKRDQESPFFR